MTPALQSSLHVAHSANVLKVIPRTADSALERQGEWPHEVQAPP